MEKQLEIFNLENNIIKIELNSWLYNAGILGLIRILSWPDEDKINDNIKIYENTIEFDRNLLDGFTDKFFEYAFKFHGKYDSIKSTIDEIKIAIEKNDFNVISKYVKNTSKEDQNTEKIAKSVIDIVKKKWSGKTYERFFTFNADIKNEVKDFNGLLFILRELLKILEDNREAFVEKEVQTFLSDFGGASFLNQVSVKENQKNKFKQDFENPIIKTSNLLDKKFNCIICDNKSKKDTIFNTGLISYLGLNKDSVNFVWKFNPKLPLCEICELIYFCVWAGYTRGFENKNFLFVNDDSSVENLINKNNLLRNLLKKNKKENILTEYFYELLLREEQQLSKFRLQNLHVIEINLSNSTFPKIYSFHISRPQAEYIKKNINFLREIANKRYKIKDTSVSIIHEFFNLFFERTLTYDYLAKLLKFYIQARGKESSNIGVYFNIYDLKIINILIFNYLTHVKQLKSINMETKQIWTIYHYGSELKQILKSKNAENKINGIAYRLLNAVRSNDQSTFMNLLLRLYIGYDRAVPGILTKALESTENFEAIGYSYINGLLGEPYNKDEKNNKE